MNLTIYTTTPAQLVHPGATIHDPDAGDLVVDEVRQLTDNGGVVWVDLYGMPPKVDANRKQRARVRYDPLTAVMIVPDADELEAVWANLQAAVDLAADAWLDEHSYDRDDPDAPAPVFTLPDGGIAIRHAGRLFGLADLSGDRGTPPPALGPRIIHAEETGRDTEPHEPGDRFPSE